MPEDLYCADSLKAFHEIYPSAKQYTGASKKYEANEVTPKKIIPTSFSLKQPKIELIDLTEDVVPSKAVKNLFPDSPESKSSNNYSGGSEASFKKSSPLKYTLSSIYEFLHEKTFVNGHRAEDDAIALLSCIIKCDKFLSWMNEKAVPFNSIKPLHNIVASSQPRNSVEAK